jgi:hypothetical protein
MRIENKYTDCSYNDISVSMQEPVDFSSYLIALRFAKIIHHHFHEFSRQGWGDIEKAGRIFLQKKSPDAAKTILIDNCENGWDKSKDVRADIKNNISIRSHELINSAEIALNLIKRKKPASQVEASIDALNIIKTSLSAYESHLIKIEGYFNEDGNFKSDGDIAYFPKVTLPMGREIDRLICKADAIIKNIIEAIEN